jgi:hypothetical protein
VARKLSTRGCIASKSVRVITTNDPSLPGYCLIAFWLALLLAHTQAPPPKAASRRERWLNRVFNTVLGLWNPGVYTIAGQLLFPVRRSLARTLPFLDLQLLLVGLSLYLFSLDMHQWRDFLKTGLTLPRYFTFTTLLFVTLSNWSLRAARRQASPLQMPGIWRGGVAIAVMELAAWKLPALKALPTTRANWFGRRTSISKKRSAQCSRGASRSSWRLSRLRSA